ncbi:Hypothetical_protein [Hexamita inflata]|uniref:Hypothetical_protein n=1 Tax=Hexamita inflata TaxID=28002 RepID=A0AA86U3E0_9EUKA|nr:Hypothetical protein HINF_LOCUS25951 [Hexamita inflata]
MITKKDVIEQFIIYLYKFKYTHQIHQNDQFLNKLNYFQARKLLHINGQKRVYLDLKTNTILQCSYFQIVIAIILVLSLIQSSQSLNFTITNDILSGWIKLSSRQNYLIVKCKCSNGYRNITLLFAKPSFNYFRKHRGERSTIEL